MKRRTRVPFFWMKSASIPMEVQEKILRVVEYSTFERVGSSESIDVDVRIIAATNADVKGSGCKKMFKQDLLDRLSFEVLICAAVAGAKGRYPAAGQSFCRTYGG